MKKLIMSVAALSLLAACATDPYTGRARFPKQRGEPVSERLPERVSAHWSVVKKAL